MGAHLKVEDARLLTAFQLAMYEELVKIRKALEALVKESET